ncbi:MAG: ABC transporter permease subunit [Chloroherpetonaceae bacterium]|nr:ABC transporter permease [Chthonomonadaceae bacterium]MDW8207029.1 ABC transporter permease subunit [Chloroherpetonaceae bacterium]
MSDLYIFRNTLRELNRPGRLWVNLLLVLLPAALALAARAAAGSRFRPETVYGNVASSLIFGFLLVILAVVNGTGVLSQEIEQKTITYLLTRPVPRWRLLLLKFLAAFLMVTVTVCASCLLVALTLFGVGRLSGAPIGRDLLILPVGALAYGALFVLMATLLQRPLMYGLLFAFGWESWVPNLPGYFRRVSLMTYLRVLAPHSREEPETLDIAQVATTLPGTQDGIPHQMAWNVLIGFSVLALMLALYTFSVREYVPRDETG